jgi:bisphosphoglycerate-independent phosphoglycerate mutase (AlkP superfamily)
MRALVSQAQSLQLRLMGGGSPGGLDSEIDHLLHPDDPA